MNTTRSQHTPLDQANTDQKRDNIKLLLAKRLTMAGLVLSISVGIVHAYLSSKVIKDFYQNEGLQATENLAALSELALLYESGDNAKEAALATLNFPSIKHVAIINKTGKILFSDGHTNETIYTSLRETDLLEPRPKIVEQNFDTWHIVAPVFTSIDDADSGLLQDIAENSRSYLGYVVAQVDGSKVQEAVTSNLLNNLLVGMAYGAVFLLIVFYALGRLLTPMSTLAKTMNQTKDGSYLKLQIEKNASQEISAIANAYNRMISALEERDYKLRGQKDLLETEVTLRTAELTQARDAALEANKYKSEILANVTHELRTPLQSILGYAEILQETLEDECMDDCLPDVNRISKNANHLLTLINSMLDIAKIEAGKMDIFNEETDILAVIRSATETVTPIIAKNGSKLLVEFEATQSTIIVDQRKVYQILLNLLSNAAKFTCDGTVTVSGNCEQGLLKLCVSDTGIGMTPEQQHQIFEPFRQVDGSESRKFEGTGLGLSIVLKFTEVLGGQVRIDSELGEGTRFTIEIPLATESTNYESPAL